MSLLRASHAIFAAAAIASVLIPWRLVSVEPSLEADLVTPSSSSARSIRNPILADAALQGRLFWGGGPIVELDAPTAAQSAGAPPPVPPQLVGTATSRHGGQAVAIVKSATGETRVMRNGEKLDGWTLTRIGNGRAIFAMDGTRHVAELARASAGTASPTSPTTGAAAPRPTQP